MQRHKLLIPALILAATFAGAGGFLAIESFFSSAGSDSSATVAAASREAVRGRRAMLRPDFSLQDLTGRTRTAAEWDGRLLLVNFWAPWCAPCREEIPALMAARNRYREQGFEVLGIAIDDPDKVAAFVREQGMDYPVLLAQEQGLALTRAFGNSIGALPFSALVTRDGRVVFTRRGVLGSEELQALIEEWL